MTGEVRLVDGKYGQMAFQKQKNRKIKSTDGCGENFIPSMAVRRFDFHKPGGYLGNVRFVVHPQPVFTY